MNLLLLRHGVAVERTEWECPDDDARPLTPKGRRQLRTSAAGMRALGLGVDVIWSSPLVRTRQTAEIIGAELKVKKPVVIVDALRPGGDVKNLLQKMSAPVAASEKLLLVGHEPDLSEFISLLVTGTTNAGFALKKGALAKLKVDKLQAGKCATLQWLLTSKQLRLYSQIRAYPSKI